MGRPSANLPNVRAIAALVLLAAERRFVDEVLDERRNELALPRDRALLTNLVFGTTRMLRPLDWLIDRCARTVDPEIRQHLRIALFQMRYLDRIPRHAAVHEAVELAKVHGKGVGGFANALLRRAVDLPLPDDLGIRTSHPDWLIDRWRPRFTNLNEILDANNTPLPISARVNPLRAPPDLLAMGPVIDINGDPTLHPGFDQGHFTVQDETFSRVAPWLEPKPGERVLDLCAAPGGKTTHLAELMQGRGEVVAVDLPDRIGLVAKAAERLYLTNVRCVPGDGATIDFPELFNAILVDAPCSNTGVLSRRPDARWRLTLGDFAVNAGLQRRLLQNAARLLRPGGRLVYATCSLEPEENRLDVPGLRTIRDELVLPTTCHSGGYTALCIRAG